MGNSTVLSVVGPVPAWSSTSPSTSRTTPTVPSALLPNKTPPPDPDPLTTVQLTSCTCPLPPGSLPPSPELSPPALWPLVMPSTVLCTHLLLPPATSSPRDTTHPLHGTRLHTPAL